MVSDCTLDLIFWKILLKTYCLKCLIRHGTIRWWDRAIAISYLNTHAVVKLLTHYIGLYDLNRK